MATTTTPPRTPGAPPRRSAPPVDPRRGTRPRPEDARTRPFTAPRHTRPTAEPTTRPTTRPAARPAPRPGGARPALARTRPRHPRAPFILLLVGLLGGALVSLLVISTTLAEGSYRITNLQQQNANLAKQEQLLTQQVAEASSPAMIAQEAAGLGMRLNPYLNFINLRTGKVVSGPVSKSDAEINVPGFTP